MATFRQKLRLFRGLLSGEVARAGPFYVNVDVTRRCNLRCPGCGCHSPLLNISLPGDRTVQDISLDLIDKIYSDLRETDTRTLYFIGEGEPLLHPHIYEIIGRAKAMGYETVLFTNGTLLDQDRIKVLLDLQLDVLKVSLWATSRAEYERQYPDADPDHFLRITEGLHCLSSLKAQRRTGLPAVFVHYPINRHNFQGIDAVIELALQTGCNAISFSPLYSRRGAFSSLALSREEEESLLLSLIRAKQRLRTLPLMHNIDLTILRYRAGNAIGKVVPCYIGWIHSRIMVDGTVYACCNCETPVGNIEKSSFREIWNNSAFRTFRRRAMTGEGIASLGETCDCEYCCYMGDNMRIHRVFKWFSPFLADRP